LNEKDNIKRIRSLINTATKKFSGMNKGSRMLLKIGVAVFTIFLLFALLLEILMISGALNIPETLKLVEWSVIYSFRFWIMIVFGAVILDILINR